MKHAIAAAAVLGVLSLASCGSMKAESDAQEMQVVSSAVVLDVTGMT